MTWVTLVATGTPETFVGAKKQLLSQIPVKTKSRAPKTLRLGPPPRAQVAWVSGPRVNSHYARQLNMWAIPLALLAVGRRAIQTPLSILYTENH